MVNFKVASENDMKKFKSVSDPRISTDGESVVFVMSAFCKFQTITVLSDLSFHTQKFPNNAS